MQTGENVRVVFPLHHNRLTDHSLQNRTSYIIMNKGCKVWSHSYLRAFCSSSICSLTVFSSLSRATSVPFTHVYTTSIGIGRQSLKRNTAVTQDSLKNVKAVTQFSSLYLENDSFSIHAGLQFGLGRKQDWALQNLFVAANPMYPIIYYGSAVFAHLLW